jgi:protein-S-isoprenylcysteine O-methyltransferase Ste14
MRYFLPPVLFVLCIVSMVLLHFLFPIWVLIPEPYRLFGGAFMVLGGWLSSRGANMFKRVGTTEMTFGEPALLVTEDIYKITRNPMYLGFALMLFGLATVLGSISPFMLVIAFITVTDLWYIRFEERVLEKKFGETYLAYKASVRRWL